MSLELREGLFVADRFRLERELGRGGMGSVWLARHTGLDILCAIKFIDQQGRDSAELRGRFEREAKSAAQLKSPNVVQILDYGVWEEHPYIAMEYLEGEDLAARLDSAWVLDAEQTCRIIAQVSKALTKAHAAGIVHRDLKPENIFLVPDGDEEIAKVLDFGIAKSSGMVMADAGTKTGSLLGTPFYMSPEQARGVKAIDHRSDLWSLAVIAYQCVTGQLPFESEGLGDVLAKIMYEPLPVPSHAKPDIPAAFDEWWRRGSSRKPEERFQSARELSDELAIALGVSKGGAVAAIAVDRNSFSEIRGSTADSDAALSLGGTVRVEATPSLRTASSAQGLTLAGDTGSPLTTTINAPLGAARNKRRAYVAAGLAAMGLVLGVVALLLFSGKPDTEAAENRAVATSPKAANAVSAKSAEVEHTQANASTPPTSGEVESPPPSGAQKPTWPSTLTRSTGAGGVKAGLVSPSDKPKPTVAKPTPEKRTPTAPHRPKAPGTKPGKPVDFGI